jgi:hypothetical protein
MSAMLAPRAEEAQEGRLRSLLRRRVPIAAASSESSLSFSSF